MSTQSTPMTNTMISATFHYSSANAVDRHNYAVRKNRKPASTGGGRAWNEDEEAYLLQTRLQKMPYKNIANSLKKTELACRLHYHQLSHSSKRYKRTKMVLASGANSTVESPAERAMPTSTHKSANIQQDSRPTSTTSLLSPFRSRLPVESSLLAGPSLYSPVRTLGSPVALLPKPCSPSRSISDPSAHSLTHLDCDVTGGPTKFFNIDEDRLCKIYKEHRDTFWGIIAADYGVGISPQALEEAWKRSFVFIAPPTPCASPNSQSSSPYMVCNPNPMQKLLSPVPEAKTNATSISALLGIDASPRSPEERELIRRIEESRDSATA